MRRRGALPAASPIRADGTLDEGPASVGSRAVVRRHLWRTRARAGVEPLASGAEVATVDDRDDERLVARLAEVRVRYLRSTLERLDYLRALRALGKTVSAREVADAFVTREDVVKQAMVAATQVDDAVEGFSGASPYEIAQRYAAGMLTREQLVDELSRWDYPPRDRTDGWDTLVLGVPGGWDEVSRARRHGLIGDDEYAAASRGKAAHKGSAT